MYVYKNKSYVYVYAYAYVYIYGNPRTLYGTVSWQDRLMKVFGSYRGTSLTRKRTPLEPYRRPMPGVLGGS